MNARFPAKKTPANAVLAVGIVGLHGLLLVFSLRPHWHPPPAANAPSALMQIWQLPAPQAQPAAAQAIPLPAQRPPRARTQERGTAPALPRPPEPALARTTPEPITPASPPPAQEAPRAASPMPREAMTGALSADSKRELAAAAQALRKESHLPPDFNVHAQPDRLAQGMAAAWRGGGATTMRSITLPDGRVMTKVTGPAGSYCAYKESNNLTGPIDVAQSGTKTRVTNCPQ